MKYLLVLLLLLTACTQAVAPTPTQETGTASPSSTGTPEKLVCYIGTDIVLNIRTCADTNCPVVGQVEPPARMPVTAVVFQGNDEWAQIEFESVQGWIAAYYQGEALAHYDPTEQCLWIRFPEPEKVGFHLMLGVKRDVLDYSDRIGTIKATTGAEVVALEAKRRNPQLTIVFRSLLTQDGQVDGPSGGEWYNPAIYYARLRPYLVDGFDYYEFINETRGPSPAVEADFNIALLDLLGRDGKCGLAFSPALGTPELDAWVEWARVIDWIAEHPCGTRYHGLALHQPGIMPDDIQTLPESYLRNLWITHRHLLINQVLRGALDDFPGPIYITELGWEDYTIPNQAFSCDQVARALRATDDFYQDSFVTGFHVWNFGGQGQWVDLTHCLPVLFEEDP